MMVFPLTLPRQTLVTWTSDLARMVWITSPIPLLYFLILFLWHSNLTKSSCIAIPESTVSDALVVNLCYCPLKFVPSELIGQTVTSYYCISGSSRCWSLSYSGPHIGRQSLSPVVTVYLGQVGVGHFLTLGPTLGAKVCHQLLL